MFPGGLPPAEHAWMEAAIRALNWLALGDLSLGDGPAGKMQDELLQVLLQSIKRFETVGLQAFDSLPIESYWKSKSVNAYGEEIHSALSFRWLNVEHSLPKREMAGVVDALEVTSGGIQDFRGNPYKYLKPQDSRVWMKTPRVMVKSEHWDEVASSLVERGICDVVPVSEVIHVDGKATFLGACSGYQKMKKLKGLLFTG